MKKSLLLVFIILFSSAIFYAQTKKVLLEEYTGAYCGQCPLGVHYTDSMLTLHPNLVAVALHAYSIWDAMDFAEIDTLNTAYSQGAPLGAIDRICSAASSNLTAVFVNQWNTKIQQRLAVPAALTVDIIPSWNSSTRNITAQVSINIYSNMSAGDYRLSLYVVEDSVTGTGAGYDQENFYDTDASSPYYGMGNPIVGFVHRHVVRALLPSSWGPQGLIPSAPVTGQNFNHTFNYTLPVSYNENRIHLVAFVYKFTSNHTGDEVLNVSEEKLLQAPAGISNNDSPGNEILVFLNPSTSLIEIRNQNPNTREIRSIEIYDVDGRKIFFQPQTAGHSPQTIACLMKSGLYLYKISDSKGKIYSGKVMVNEI